MRTAEPSLVVFGFEEGGLLRVFPSAEAATHEYEGVDVESGTVHFYDRRGTYLKPVLIEPNRRGKLFSLISCTVSGSYQLVPDADPSEDPFALALLEVRSMEPNAWFSSVEALKQELAAEGVIVTWNPEHSSSGT